MRIKVYAVATGLFLIAGLVLAGQVAGHRLNVGAADSHHSKAVAVLHPTDGNTVSGTVTFTNENGAVKVVADLSGLKPGTHGFHIHEFGDCSAKDGTSAGGHFNPGAMPHGAPSDKQRHAGDLGNIVADADGKAHVEVADSVLKLDGDMSIIGRGVIVHAAADDLKTQPTGNAGGRQACGVIGIAKH